MIKKEKILGLKYFNLIFLNYIIFKIVLIQCILNEYWCILGQTNQSGGIAWMNWPFCHFMFILIFSIFLLDKLQVIQCILNEYWCILGQKNQSGGIACRNWPSFHFMPILIYFNFFNQWIMSDSNCIAYSICIALSTITMIPI